MVDCCCSPTTCPLQCMLAFPAAWKVVNPQKGKACWHQTCVPAFSPPQAVGSVAIGVGRQFSKYMPSFYPYLKAGLVNHQEWQVRWAHALSFALCPQLRNQQAGSVVIASFATTRSGRCGGRIASAVQRGCILASQRGWDGVVAV